MRNYANLLMRFNISAPKNGWMNGQICLKNKSMDFRMSAVFGDDITELIRLVWSNVPNVMEKDRKYQWKIDDDNFPYSSVEINEEGSKVIISVLEAKKKDYLHIKVKRICENEDIEPKEIECDVTFFEFALSIIGSINNLINKCGLLTYNQEWWKPFPLTDFLVVKALLMGKEMSAFNDELNLLKAPFYISIITEPIRKITLVSDNVCFGPVPEFEDVTKQKITITTSGKVFISQYTFGGIQREKEILSIDKEDALDIINDLADYFDEDTLYTYATDTGWWNLSLTGVNGKTFKFDGALLYYENDWLGIFSRKLRRYLKRWDLLLFDGNTKEEGNIIYCSCEFNQGSSSYYYRTEDETIQIGDYVRVPVGDNGRTAIVEVVDIDYYSEENVPMPLERVKTIISKIVDDE